MVLADTETRLQRGGPLGFEAARAEALAHLRGRLDALRDEPPERRAGLRFALLRLEALAGPDQPPMRPGGKRR